jgi:hypothetical protein
VSMPVLGWSSTGRRHQGLTGGSSTTGSSVALGGAYSPTLSWKAANFTCLLLSRRGSSSVAHRLVVRG